MEQIDYISENIAEADNYIAGRCSLRPKTAIILGSGMSSALPPVEERLVIPYRDIPHFPPISVSGHQGELVCGRLEGRPLFAMLGRYHYYEGYTMRGVVFPIRVLAGLGVETVILTNAAGGINRRYRVGDFMLVRDHLNFMGGNPLIGPNNDELGPRFLNMNDAYDPTLLALAEDACRRLRIKYHLGVLAAVSGPNYETRAELSFLAGAGADAVTMSTVPEVIAARHAGLRVAALSLITNATSEKHRLTHEDVLEAAHQAIEILQAWLREMVGKI